MAASALYGVIVGDGRKPGTFALRRNQREAKTAAREAGGKVYVIRPEPEARVWDAPTFMACGKFVTAYAKPRN